MEIPSFGLFSDSSLMQEKRKTGQGSRQEAQLKKKALRVAYLTHPRSRRIACKGVDSYAPQCSRIADCGQTEL
jgi:hypothetical protein